MPAAKTRQACRVPGHDTGTAVHADRPGPIVTAATPPRKPPPVPHAEGAPAVRRRVAPARPAGRMPHGERPDGAALHVGRVARANATRPVKETATT
mgnify:CR=1 FL=1